MRANRELCIAGGDAFKGRSLLLSQEAAREPLDPYSERLEPIRKFMEMLFSQNFGRRHYSDLVAVLQRLQSRQHCDDGFTAAHVALQQALGRMRRCQVTPDVARGFQLRTR